MYITPFCSVRDGQRVCSFKQKLRRRAWSLSHEIFRKAAHYVEEQNSRYFKSFLKTLFFSLSARSYGHLILTNPKDFTLISPGMDQG